jgi:hypothetical protein
VRIAIETNTTPIRAGDDITIDFHPTWPDFGIVYYSVHLSFDGGQTFPRTLAAQLFVPKFNWTVDAIGTGLRILVVGYRPVLARRARSPIFTVVPSTPFVTAPVANERLSLAGPTTVHWEQIPPQPSQYTISCSHDGGTTFQDLTSPSGAARSSAVTFPGPATDHATLRLSGRFVGFQADFFHDVPIRLADEAIVHVTSPYTNAIWHLGDTGRIAWSHVGPVDHFSIELSRNNGQSWTMVASNVSGAQREFMCPVDPPTSESCKVRVKAHWSGGSVSDVSDHVFHIRA